MVQTFEKFWTGLASQRITITNPALEEPTEDIVEQGTEDNTQADDVEWFSKDFKLKHYK